MNRWRKRGLVAGLLLAAMAWVGLLGLTVPAPPASTATLGGERARIRYVDDSHFPAITAYVSVTDPQGQVVSGLNADQFDLSEDGIHQPVSNLVPAGQQPLAVLLLVDRSGSMKGEKLAGAQQAARTFVTHLTDGRDRAGLVAFDDQARVLAPVALLDPGGRAALLAAIDQIAPGGNTGLYNAIYDSLDSLAGQPGRRAVIALTDGQDNASGSFLGLWRWGRSLDETAKHATGDRVPVYTIGLGDDVDQNALERLASTTGAEFQFAPNGGDLAALYQQLGASLQSEYALTYQSPTPNREGSQRALMVRVTLPDGVIQSSGGYNPGGVLAPRVQPEALIPVGAGLAILLLFGAAVPALRSRRRGPMTAGTDPAVGVAPAPALMANAGRVSISFGEALSPVAAQRAVMAEHGATCRECGRKIRAEARFCWWCGARRE